jgi:hypothetical protein
MQYMATVITDVAVFFLICICITFIINTVQCNFRDPKGLYASVITDDVSK